MGLELYQNRRSQWFAGTVDLSTASPPLAVTSFQDFHLLLGIAAVVGQSAGPTSASGVRLFFGDPDADPATWLGPVAVLTSGFSLPFNPPACSRPGDFLIADWTEGEGPFDGVLSVSGCFMAKGESGIIFGTGGSPPMIIFPPMSFIQLNTPNVVKFGTNGNDNLFVPVTGDGLSRFDLSGGLIPGEGFNPQTALWTNTSDTVLTLAITLSCAINAAPALADFEWALGISVSGDLNGVAGDSAAAIAKGSQPTQSTKLGGNMTATCQRYVTIGADATISPVGCFFGDVHDLNIMALSMSMERVETAV